MSLSKLRQLLLRFGRSEDGASITEFVIFLPIWIMVFIGIINLGRVGIFGTKVQLRAQRELWNKSIQVTSQFESIEHQSAVGSAVITAAAYGQVAGLPNNDQVGNDGVEAIATGVGMGAYGHFGESAEKAFIPASLAVPSAIRGKYDPKEVLGQDDTNRYPHKIVNDTLAAQSFSGGIASIITTVIAASGFVQSTAAGIRYGSVFSSYNESSTFIGRYGDFSAGAHFDALVSPRALKGAEAEAVPFAIAFLLFKADEEYDEFQLFGDDNWGGTTADNSRIPDTDTDDEVDAGVEAECEERMANTTYDPDAENPGPEPSWWDTCN